MYFCIGSFIESSEKSKKTLEEQNQKHLINYAKNLNMLS